MDQTRLQHWRQCEIVVRQMVGSVLAASGTNFQAGSDHCLQCGCSLPALKLRRDHCNCLHCLAGRRCQTALKIVWTPTEVHLINIGFHIVPANWGFHKVVPPRSLLQLSFQRVCPLGPWARTSGVFWEHCSPQGVPFGRYTVFLHL